MKTLKAVVVGTAFRLHYTHTEKTMGGDIQTRGILSTWQNRGDAEAAELRAWAEYEWSPERTETYIREEKILKQNAKADS